MCGFCQSGSCLAAASECCLLHNVHVPGHEAWKREHATHVLPEEEARHLSFLVLMDCDNGLHQDTPWHDLVGHLIQQDGSSSSCNWHMPIGRQSTAMHLIYKLEGK